MQYLYLIKCQKYYKIGITKDVKGRLTKLQSGNPFDIELVARYEFPDMYSAYRVEQKFHKILNQYHVKGEWFELDDTAFELVKDCFNSIIDNDTNKLIERATKLKKYMLTLLTVFLLACTISTLPTVATTRTASQHAAEMRWQQVKAHEFAQPDGNKPSEWVP